VATFETFRKGCLCQVFHTQDQNLATRWLHIFGRLVLGMSIRIATGHWPSVMTVLAWTGNIALWDDSRKAITEELDLHFAHLVMNEEASTPNPRRLYR
jgi:hypothetical protein